jgi:hypothetical protein
MSLLFLRVHGISKKIYTSHMLEVRFMGVESKEDSAGLTGRLSKEGEWDCGHHSHQSYKTSKRCPDSSYRTTNCHPLQRTKADYVPSLPNAHPTLTITPTLHSPLQKSTSFTRWERPSQAITLIRLWCRREEGAQCWSEEGCRGQEGKSTRRRDRCLGSYRTWISQ